MKHEFAAASRLHQILQFLASAQELQTFDSEFKHIGIPWNNYFVIKFVYLFEWSNAKWSFGRVGF